MKLLEDSRFENVKIGNLAKCNEWPKTVLKIIYERCPTHAVPRAVSLKLSSVALYNHPFSKYCIFYHFSIDSHVTISQCHKMFKNEVIGKKYNSPYSSRGTQCSHKDWLRSDQNCRKSDILKFAAPYGLFVT